MFCPHCGQPVAESATFCGSCGRALTEEPEFAEAGNEEEDFGLASPGVRARALAVDALVMLDVFVLVAWLTGTALIIRGDWEGHRPAFLLAAAAGVVACLVVLTYFNASSHSPGATVFDMAIVDAENQDIGCLRGLVRSLAAVFLSLPPFGLGFWWALRDPDRRTWHDHIAGSWVVNTREPGQRWIPPPWPGWGGE